MQPPASNTAYIVDPIEQAYRKKAEDLSNAGALRAYLVVVRQVGEDGKDKVLQLVFTAPSFSHVAAKYDRPEAGMEIIKQEFLARGEVSLAELAQKAMLGELATDKEVDLAGLKMCTACVHDWQPTQTRCTYGHRMDGEPANRICRGFRRK